ncbi:hypothetical protein EJ08DRAFT_491728 [Tothia fuscella]|uniref:Uncharacterized protein n=1 Tax=Tothia fuscella TaxID=1048955 RepID=A0A9P4NHS9_9PEZI|nr:hypothetical protein EJ08DRAFT_491728 [Tothia fuscella]
MAQNPGDDPSFAANVASYRSMAVQWCREELESVQSTVGAVKMPDMFPSLAIERDREGNLSDQTSLNENSILAYENANTAWTPLGDDAAKEERRKVVSQSMSRLEDAFDHPIASTVIAPKDEQEIPEQDWSNQPTPEHLDLRGIEGNRQWSHDVEANCRKMKGKHSQESPSYAAVSGYLNDTSEAAIKSELRIKDVGVGDLFPYYGQASSHAETAKDAATTMNAATPDGKSSDHSSTCNIQEKGGPSDTFLLHYLAPNHTDIAKKATTTSIMLESEEESHDCDSDADVEDIDTRIAWQIEEKELLRQLEEIERKEKEKARLDREQREPDRSHRRQISEAIVAAGIAGAEAHSQHQESQEDQANLSTLSNTVRNNVGSETAFHMKNTRGRVRSRSRSRSRSLSRSRGFFRSKSRSTFEGKRAAGVAALAALGALVRTGKSKTQGSSRMSDPHDDTNIRGFQKEASLSISSATEAHRKQQGKPESGPESIHEQVPNFSGYASEKDEEFNTNPLGLPLPHPRSSVALSDDAPSGLFDWSQPASDNYTQAIEDWNGSNSPQLRSRSAPRISKIEEERETVTTGKFSTWGLASKAVDASWDDDFGLRENQDVAFNKGTKLIEAASTEHQEYSQLKPVGQNLPRSITEGWTKPQIETSSAKIFDSLPVQSTVMSLPSACDSDIESLAGSVFSYGGSSYTSMTSAMSMELFINTTERLVSLVLNNKELKALCMEAVENANVGPDRFERNFRRLLTTFGLGLSKEANEEDQKLAGEFVRRQSGRIARTIRQSCAESSQNRTQKFLEGPKKGEVDSSTEDEDGHQGIDGEQLRHFFKVKLFILQSEAFKALRAGLADFVNPTFESKLKELAGKVTRSREKYGVTLAELKDFRR